MYDSILSCAFGSPEGLLTARSTHSRRPFAPRPYAEPVGNPTTGRRTPARIRIWTAAVLVLAAATLASATVAVADTQRGISDVSLRAAPQARATSDLYFALSDLDAQVARRMLDTGDDDLVGPLLDAELTFNRRLSDVNRDLQQAIAGAGDAVSRSAFDELLDGVSTYHTMASHGLALDESSAETQKGQAAPEALAYYSQATDLMHFELLPTAEKLRDAYAKQLTAASNDEHDAFVLNVVLVVASGAALLVALFGLQLFLRRRFGRTLNVYLATATLATLAVLIGAMFMSSQQSARIKTAIGDHEIPYLNIQHTRAVTYDATGGLIRNALAPTFGYNFDFEADSATLRNAQGSGLLTSSLVKTDPALSTKINKSWDAILHDKSTLDGDISAGLVEQTLEEATGIARGQISMDFYSLDVALNNAAGVQSAAFEEQMSAANSDASGWAGVPAAVLGAVMVLTLVGVRPAVVGVPLTESVSESSRALEPFRAPVRILE